MSDPTTDPFYCCPVCGRFGGAVQLGPAAYGACDVHRLRWHVQSGGYHWDEDSERVATYDVVPAGIGQLLEEARAREEAET